MNAVASPQLVVVTLGPKRAAAEWYGIPEVRRVVSFTGASASGSRFGRRALGLGVDAFIVTLMACVRARGVTFLATNPWIAVWVRVLTRRPVVVTGLYAWPGTRHWRILKAFLKNCPVIALSTVETANWIAEGGRAEFVRYGNTFPYTESSRDPRVLTIFVGGTSDRDRQALTVLESEVLDSEDAIHLVVAIADSPSVRTRGHARVEHFGPVSQTEFGTLMAAADLTYLPLIENPRAAGHMILVGSLQVGTPVLISGGCGLDGYIDSVFVRRIGSSDSVLSSIRAQAHGAPSSGETMAYWHAKFSRTAYLSQVRAAALGLLQEGTSS